MRRLLPLLLALLLLPAPVAGADGGGSRRLTILFTNDVHGYVEPCG
jgi:2',3'-cyclic-nucleotide 2'-phosphodiesterase (5'-nucleotidase family)